VRRQAQIHKSLYEATFSTSLLIQSTWTTLTRSVAADKLVHRPISPDGYPVDSPSPNMLCFRYEFDTGLDNSVVCDRFDGHGLLC